MVLLYSGFLYEAKSVMEERHVVAANGDFLETKRAHVGYEVHRIGNGAENAIHRIARGVCSCGERSCAESRAASFGKQLL